MLSRRRLIQRVSNRMEFCLAIGQLDRGEIARWRDELDRIGQPWPKLWRSSHKPFQEQKTVRPSPSRKKVHKTIQEMESQLKED